MVHSPDGDTYIFNIDAGVFQVDTQIAQYLLILCLDYVPQTSIDLIKGIVFS